MHMDARELADTLVSVAAHVGGRAGGGARRAPAVRPSFQVLDALEQAEGHTLNQRDLVGRVRRTSGTLSVRLGRLERARSDRARAGSGEPPQRHRDADRPRTRAGAGCPPGLRRASRAPPGGTPGWERPAPLGSALQAWLAFFEPDEGVTPRLGVAVATAAVAKRMRRAVGLPDESGVLVMRVRRDSPADAAGLARGDLVTRGRRRRGALRRRPRAGGPGGGRHADAPRAAGRRAAGAGGAVRRGLSRRPGSVQQQPKRDHQQSEHGADQRLAHQRRPWRSARTPVTISAATIDAAATQTLTRTASESEPSVAHTTSTASSTGTRPVEQRQLPDGGAGERLVFERLLPLEALAGSTASRRPPASRSASPGRRRRWSCRTSRSGRSRPPAAWRRRSSRTPARRRSGACRPFCPVKAPAVSVGSGAHRHRRPPRRARTRACAAPRSGSRSPPCSPTTSTATSSQRRRVAVDALEDVERARRQAQGER